MMQNHTRAERTDYHLLFQCFHKTLGTRRRQWPPSKQEILCTINRRPIYARFHFMDGQFHAIEFDPSATADEVARLVKAKIGLREGAMGYAIYEVLGTQERSLMPDEKVVEKKFTVLKRG